MRVCVCVCVCVCDGRGGRDIHRLDLHHLAPDDVKDRVGVVARKLCVWVFVIVIGGGWDLEVSGLCEPMDTFRIDTLLRVCECMFTSACAPRE